uniref:Uncharacterized protein n=1 Tax=Heterorhabditis bacteriophora TaxID=37862 RepID=A0A1I7WGP3_HETBA
METDDVDNVLIRQLSCLGTNDKEQILGDGTLSQDMCAFFLDMTNCYNSYFEILGICKMLWERTTIMVKLTMLVKCRSLIFLCWICSWLRISLLEKWI